jgi:hypothetical protein
MRWRSPDPKVVSWADKMPPIKLLELICGGENFLVFWVGRRQDA